MAVIGGLWTALNYPTAFILFLVLFLVFVIWLLPKIWRAVKRLFHRLGRFFGNDKEPPLETRSPEERAETLKSLFMDDGRPADSLKK